MRDFFAVMKCVIELVPDEQPELRASLQRIVDRAVYYAPETVWAYGGQKVLNVLNDTIPIPPPEWARPLLMTFMGGRVWLAFCHAHGIDVPGVPQ